MSGGCRKNVKQNALDSAEKESRETYKDDRQKVKEKSDFRTYTRKSNRASEKLSEYLAEWDQSRKRGRENIESEREEQLNTSRKNTRENVECEKEDQEKTVSKSHRVENGRSQEKKIVDESESGNASQPRNRKRKDENGNEIGSNMCHQCQRNDKGRVVRCTRCKTKRYCVPCMTRWYPGMRKAAFKESCPVCRQNCNCKACLRMDWPIRALKNLCVVSSEEEKIQYSKFIVQKLLPFFRRFNAEQVMEMEIEAKIQGVPVS